jgi:hypothetical protein
MREQAGPTSDGTRARLASDGFVVLPGVLTPDEVSELRHQVDLVLDAKGVDKAGGTVLPNAAAEAPILSWIFCHPGILAAVRSATGMDEMVFTMEADLHRNYLAAKWHKDTGEQMMADGYFGCDAIASPDCRVYKVALYLQDHSPRIGSLHVRPGSITTPRLDQGNDVPLAVNAGDVVLFDVRITHRGVAPGAVDWALFGAAKLLSPRHPAPLAARLRRRRMRLAGRPDRMAVYFAFGMPNEQSRTFAQRNMKRQLSQLRGASATLPTELVDSFQNSHISTVAI